MPYFNRIKYLLILLFNICLLINKLNAISINKSAYHDIIIDISENVPVENCTRILEKIENAFISASHHLFTALDGRAYFGSVVINLPEKWNNNCVPENRSISVSNGDNSDITITKTNHLFGDRTWTQQSSGCGEQGDQIYISYNGLNSEYIGKEILHEWAKYRYGVFDEIGYDDDNVYPKCHFTDSQRVTGCSDSYIKDIGICQNRNPFAEMEKTIDKKARSSLMFVPQANNVIMFCDEGTHDRYAPTKHNLLCERKSTLEIILKHSDFLQNNMVKITPTTIINTIPKFYYRRRLLTRYVLIIDETQDIMVRESWSFLRSAIRKWVVYDLKLNTEIGIVLAKDTSVDKILDITPLDIQKNRDLVASFLPYAPIDSRQPACITCAIKESLKMLKYRNEINGNANNIILIIAPGIDNNTDLNDLTNIAINNKTKIVTINYPNIARRYPLDIIAKMSNGNSFTVQEQKYNSEKSLLDTYFELTTILFHISNMYYEGSKSNLQMEIHRKRLVDVVHDTNSSKRISRVISGNFYMDDALRTPSGFYIYTHNIEFPLIHGVKLTSPNGKTYSSRSDQRISVKQLSLIATISSTGSWTYKIERFNGHPQPHYLQVLATPASSDAPVINAKAWIKKSKSGGPYIIYCQIKRGNYPIRSAFIEVTVNHIDKQCNLPNDCIKKFQLLDTGSGDPDIIKGDGIYTKYFSAIDTGPGTYKFDIVIDDNGNTAYALHNDAAILNLPCCGSFITDKYAKQITPFQRILPSITIQITNDDITEELKSSVGRIGDLTVTFIEEGKILLSWTSPDMGGYNVARYEIKYAMNIQDIVDNYDTAAIMWNHENPYPLTIGDLTNFIIDINNEPNLYGEAVYFAIRPYSKLSMDAIPGPISNPVRIFIPNKILLTTYLPEHHLNNDINIWQYNNRNTNLPDIYGKNNNIPFYKNEIDIKMKHAIPIVAGILFVLILICIYCIVCIIRRRSNNNNNNNNLNSLRKQIKQTKDNSSNESNHSTPSHDNNCLYSNKTNNTLSPLHIIQEQQQQQQQLQPLHHHIHQQHIQQNQTQLSLNNQSYNTIELPDPHTVGIPIYSDDEIQQKHLSITNLQEKLLIEELKQQDPNLDIIQTQPTLYTNYSGVSIISTHQGRILSPYESWTASQLLHEHERRTSPMDDLINQNQQSILLNNSDRMSLNSNCTAPPPVPPLPYNQDNIYQTENHHHHHNYNHQQQLCNLQNITTQQFSPQPPTYSTISRNKSSIASVASSLPSSTTTSSTTHDSVNNSLKCNDKKRRNVTMV